VCFQVVAADSFSERAATIVASMSSTNPGNAWPSTMVAGSERRVSRTCAQASSRAAARAARSRAKAAVSIASRTRHAVGSEATGPNRPPRQIDDGFAAVSHEHRQVDRDAAWFVRWPALPVQAQCLDEAAGQPGLVSQIGEQTGAG
jgi:hypothetical protein